MLETFMIFWIMMFGNGAEAPEQTIDSTVVVQPMSPGGGCPGGLCDKPQG